MSITRDVVSKISELTPLTTREIIARIIHHAIKIPTIQLKRYNDDEDHEFRVLSNCDDQYGVSLTTDRIKIRKQNDYRFIKSIHLWGFADTTIEYDFEEMQVKTIHEQCYQIANDIEIWCVNYQDQIDDELMFEPHRLTLEREHCTEHQLQEIFGNVPKNIHPLVIKQLEQYFKSDNLKAYAKLYPLIEAYIGQTYDQNQIIESYDLKNYPFTFSKLLGFLELDKDTGNRNVYYNAIVKHTPDEDIVRKTPGRRGGNKSESSSVFNLNN